MLVLGLECLDNNYCDLERINKTDSGTLKIPLFVLS